MRLLAVTTAGVATLALSAVSATAATTVGTAGWSSGSAVEQECQDKASDEGASARGGRDLDHRDVSAAEQKAIEARTQRILDRRGIALNKAKQAAATVPVYVHVMAAKSGAGDVTDAQISDQIDVLNATFGGQESNEAANSGFSFTLAGTDRFYNDTWHRDGASSKYRKQTRRGGADALNIWLVDFKYLGIATFPWDYSRSPGTDGIRVHYDSLPGGTIANFNLGETATHEAGHWFGLYHTFQGGCTTTNDEVADTPAQGGPSSGCPEGADTCSLPGLDPIHNYMDYSFDSCYNQFTAGQSSRMSQMWTAYRA
jgi:hypothetical protein